MGTSYYAGVQTWVPSEEGRSRGYWNAITTWAFGKDYLLGIALYEIALDATPQPQWPEPDSDTGWEGTYDEPAGSEYGERRAVILPDAIALPDPEKVYEQGDRRLEYDLFIEYIKRLQDASLKVRVVLWTH